MLLFGTVASLKPAPQSSSFQPSPNSFLHAIQTNQEKGNNNNCSSSSACQEQQLYWLHIGHQWHYSLFLISGLTGIVVIWRHEIFKEFIAHNYIKNFPAFAYFTSTPNKEMEGEKEKKEEQATTAVAFSEKITIANILLSTAGHIAFINILADWNNIPISMQLSLCTSNIISTSLTIFPEKNTEC